MSQQLTTYTPPSGDFEIQFGDPWLPYPVEGCELRLISPAGVFGGKFGTIFSIEIQPAFLPQAFSHLDTKSHILQEMDFVLHSLVERVSKIDGSIREINRREAVVGGLRACEATVELKYPSGWGAISNITLLIVQQKVFVLRLVVPDVCAFENAKQAVKEVIRSMKLKSPPNVQ